MRITEKAIYGAAQTSTALARERMERATAEAGTGLRVRSPGDDPVAASMEVRVRAEQSAHNSSIQVLDDSTAELEVADGSLGGIADALQRAYELSVQAANGVLAASEREHVALEVEGLMHQVVTLSNVKVGDRYIFGGTGDTSQPFSDVGAFLGQRDTRQVEIYPGIVQPVSVRLDLALKGNGTAGEDAFKALTDFAAGLRANDQTQLLASVGSLGRSVDQVQSSRVEAGTTHNMISMARSAAETALMAATERKSKLTEVDAFQAATNLSMAQRAMEAAISASAQSFKFTLLNKLG